MGLCHSNTRHGASPLPVQAPSTTGSAAAEAEPAPTLKASLPPTTPSTAPHPLTATAAAPSTARAVRPTAPQPTRHASRAAGLAAPSLPGTPAAATLAHSRDSREGCEPDRVETVAEQSSPCGLDAKRSSARPGAAGARPKSLPHIEPHTLSLTLTGHALVLCPQGEDSPPHIEPGAALLIAPHAQRDTLEGTLTGEHRTRAPTAGEAQVRAKPGRSPALRQNPEHAVRGAFPCSPAPAVRAALPGPAHTPRPSQGGQGKPAALPTVGLPVFVPKQRADGSPAAGKKKPPVPPAPKLHPRRGRPTGPAVGSTPRGSPACDAPQLSHHVSMRSPALPCKMLRAQAPRPARSRAVRARPEHPQRAERHPATESPPAPARFVSNLCEQTKPLAHRLRRPSAPAPAVSRASIEDKEGPCPPRHRLFRNSSLARATPRTPQGMSFRGKV